VSKTSTRRIPAPLVAGSTLGAQTANKAAPVVQISEVRTELNRLRQELTYAQNAFGELVQRLGEGGVLTIPDEAAQAPDEASPSSPLANELRGMSYGTEQLVRDINRTRHALAI